MSDRFLGEFEQMVLLAVLQLGEQARAIDLRRHLKSRTGRRPTRGALYATLDRLHRKGFLDWDTEEAAPSRGGIPRRRFCVSTAGLAELRRSWKALSNLTEGLDRLLEEP